MVHLCRALGARGAAHVAERVLRVVILRVGRDELVKSIRVACVPGVIEPLGHGLVLLGHGSPFGRRGGVVAESCKAPFPRRRRLRHVRYFTSPRRTWRRP